MQSGEPEIETSHIESILAEFSTFGLAETYDAARAQFAIACNGFAENPTTARATEELGNAAGELSQQFQIAMRDAFSYDETDLDGKLAAIAGHIRGDADIRVLAFNSSLKTETFESLEMAEFQELLMEALYEIYGDSNDTEEFLESVFNQLYFRNLDQGIGVFTNLALHNYRLEQEQAEAVPGTIEIDLKAQALRLIGKTALDVAKIGAGVTLGLLLAKKLKKG